MQKPWCSKEENAFHERSTVKEAITNDDSALMPERKDSKDIVDICSFGSKKLSLLKQSLLNVRHGRQQKPCVIIIFIF